MRNEGYEENNLFTFPFLFSCSFCLWRAGGPFHAEIVKLFLPETTRPFLFSTMLARSYEDQFIRSGAACQIFS